MSDFNIDFIKIKRDSNLEKLIISVDTFSLKTLQSVVLVLQKPTKPRFIYF